MARYDKYDPKDGGFRALLAADFSTEGDLETAFGVSLNASGHVVIGGGGNTDIVGVMILTKLANAGDVVDLMTDGEIVELAGTAGSIYYTRHDTGALTTNSDPAGDGSIATTRVGHSVEADRLVVRTAR